MSSSKDLIYFYNKSWEKASVTSQLLEFLHKQMPKLLTKEKAAKLELETKSEDKRTADKARKNTQKYLETFVMKKADILVLMSIKLHTDIHPPSGYSEHNPFIIIKDGRFELEFQRTNAAKVYREAILEMSIKEPLYFIYAYTAALFPSDIKASATESSYETPLRKLSFINTKIYHDRKLMETCENICLLLHRTPISYPTVMLSIIDLHYKITATEEEKKQINTAMYFWQEMLKWDVKHLKKHANKPQDFFKIAHDILKHELRFEGKGLSEITSVRDMAQVFDKYNGYQYKPETREQILGRIEKEWRAWKRKLQPNTTTPAPNSKPKKKTYFKVNLTCHALLTNGTINKTQPSSIKTVIELLSTNSKTALKELQSHINLTPPANTKDKKPIAAHIDKATSSKIKTLKKKFNFSSVYHLLEFAVQYYEKTNGRAATIPENNAPNNNHLQKLSQQSKPTDITAREQLSDANQYAAIKEPTDTEPAIEQLQVINNKPDFQHDLVPSTTNDRKPLRHTQEKAPPETAVIDKRKSAKLTLNSGKTIHVTLLERRTWKGLPKAYK